MTDTKKAYDEALASIDTETTRIGTKVEELVAKLAAGGMSAEEEAASLEQIKALGGRLKLIAADPAAPVPPAEPEV